MADNFNKTANGIETPAITLPGGDIQTQINSKQSTITLGNLTDAGTDGITVTGGTNAVVGSGTSLSQHIADSTHNGYLSSTDWSTFNSKQAAGSYITALTGEVTAAGPGSSAATISNAAVIAKVLTGFVSGAGSVTSADSLLTAANKFDGNIAATVAVANAALPSASFTDAAVTAKLLTGFSSSAGTVAATDSILVAFNKVTGNIALRAPLASPTFTGVVLFPDGTNSAPGIAFSADTNTGIYRPSADVIAFTVNGLSDKLELNTSSVQIYNHQLVNYMDNSGAVTWPLISIQGSTAQAANSNWFGYDIAASVTAASASTGMRINYAAGTSGAGRTVTGLKVLLNGGGAINLNSACAFLQANTASTNTLSGYNSTGPRGLHVTYANSNTTTGSGCIGGLILGDTCNTGIGLQIGGGGLSVGSTPKQFGLISVISKNTGSGSSGTANTVYNAGYFKIGSDVTATLFDSRPTINAALIASNGDTTDDIIVAQQDATTVFKVVNSGQIQSASLTASTIVQTDASKNLVSGISAAFVDATSSIQTQLNAKAPIASPSFTGTVTTSGVFQGAVGASNSPTFSFATDSDTGFYHGASANELYLTLGGTPTVLFTGAELGFPTAINLGKAGGQEVGRLLCNNISVTDNQANSTSGKATLVLGTVVVSTTAVTANSRIQLTAQNLGTITAPVGLAVSARTPGTSFTILSGNLTDTSDIAWFIVEPN